MDHLGFFVLLVSEVALLRIPEVCADVVGQRAGLNVQNLLHDLPVNDVFWLLLLRKKLR